MTVIGLDECLSTNSHLASIAHECSHGTVIWTKAQTSGRGQRGNSWEALPGENVTMSILLRPDGLPPARQFILSEAVSLAIVGVLNRYLPKNSVKIKWPNDIYVGDGKICGILIENTISGMNITSSIVGIGLNVNQRQFHSDAPNPVSMAQLTDRRYDVETLVFEIAEEIIRETDKAVAAVKSESFKSADVATDRQYNGNCETNVKNLEQQYFSALWRNDGFYPYIDNLRNEHIVARIFAVAPDGRLTLQLPDSTLRSYFFKEVTAEI